MLPKINPAATEAWKRLAAHREALAGVHLKTLFARDPLRFERFSLRFAADDDLASQDQLSHADSSRRICPAIAERTQSSRLPKLICFPNSPGE